MNAMYRAIIPPAGNEKNTTMKYRHTNGKGTKKNNKIFKFGPNFFVKQND